MQVAVAGVAPATGLQTVTFPDRDRLLDRLLDAVERDRDVLAHLPPAPGLDRDRDAVAPPPQRLHLAPTGGRSHGKRVDAHGLHQLALNALGLGLGAVGLGDHHEACALGDAARKRAAGRGQGATVQVLERGHGQPGAQHALDRPAARLGAGMECDHGKRCLRRRQQLEPGRGDHAQRSLRADQEALQVIAGHVLADRAADLDDLAGWDDRLQPGHPGARDPVLEGVRTAGVRGDVSADLRLLGGAGIGRKEEAVLARQPADLGRAQPRLDADPPQQWLEVADPRHPLEAQDDAPVQGHGAGRETRAAPARHDRHLVLVAPGHDAGDLRGRRRQRDRVGAALDAAVLGRVRQVGRRRRADRARPEQLAELRLDLGGAPPRRRGPAQSAFLSRMGSSFAGDDEATGRLPALSIPPEFFAWCNGRTLRSSNRGSIDYRKGVRGCLRVSVLRGGLCAGRWLADAQAMSPLPQKLGAGGRDAAQRAEAARPSSARRGLVDR